MQHTKWLPQAIDGRRGFAFLVLVVVLIGGLLQACVCAARDGRKTADDKINENAFISVWNGFPSLTHFLYFV